MCSNAGRIALFEELRKRPEVKSRLHDLRKLRKQAILDKVEPRAAPARKPTFIGADAFTRLVTVRHKHEAINALVLGQLQCLDPTISDASCEEHVPLVLDLHKRVAAVIEDGDVALVQDYITAHAGDKADTKVRTVADVLGASHAPAYDALVRRVEAALGDDITIARLCYTFTENSVWSKDEMNLRFSYHSKAPMDVVGEATDNRGGLIKFELGLRVELAHAAHVAFLNKITQLPRFEAPIPDAPQFFIDNQLLLASELMQPYIPSAIPYPFQDKSDPVPYLRTEQVELPFLPIFNQMFSIFYMMFNEGRGIIVRVRRDEMTPIADSYPKKRYTQKFAGIYYLLFKPNHATGLFEVVEPTGDDTNCNFLVLDAWSKYCIDSNGTGLDAASLDEHRTALAGSNLLWLILQYAATRPDHICATAAKNIDYTEGYRAVCMPQPKGVAFHPTREQFPQLHLKVHLPGETRPNLHDLWVLARIHGGQRALYKDCQAIVGPFCNTYERIDRPVDLQFDHLFAASLGWIEADTHALVAKHQAAPDAVFGPTVVCVGDGGLSFVELAKVNEVLRMENDDEKKARYKVIHPENASFVGA